jgi:transposase
MSVYVGIDVHRKRSQVAVIDAKGEVLANRNVPNGVEPILKVIGGLPPGTPAAFEACYGTSWLAGCWRITGLPRTWCTRRGARRSPRPG